MDRTSDSAHRRHNDGYTLIELLVVMAFISILAALAINRFQHVSERSIDAAIKSDLRNALNAEEQYYADEGVYLPFAVVNGGTTATPPFTASPGVSITAALQGGGVMIVGSHPVVSHSWCLSTSSSTIVAASSC